MSMRPAPYDLRLAARTLALSVVALSVVGLIEWITDERGVATPGTGGRSIGLLPLVPVAGAIAVLVALAPAKASGELRALSALGAAPLRARAAPIVTAALLACLAGVFVAAGAMDVAPLFPPPSIASDYRVEHDERGAVVFVSARRHTKVDEQDVLTRADDAPIDRGNESTLPRHAVLAAALAIAAAGTALALWVGSPLRSRPLRTLIVGALYGAAQVAAFQSAGARAIPALTIVVPSLLLLAIAMLEHRAARLSHTDPWL
jgi:hypothetical protein